MDKEKVKKPFYKKWWFWVIVVVLVIGVASGGSDDEETEGNDKEATKTTAKADKEDNQEEPEESEEEIEEEVEEEKEEPIPDAITYEGNGDDVIDIERTEEGPVVLYIKGNDSSSHFAVKGADDNDNDTELFVNTTDPYEGITLDPTGETTTLEITSDGAWEIESRSLRSMEVIDTSDKYEGVGDDILLVEGNPKKADITGNESENHFAVRGYNPNADLLVNTTDNYEGTTKVKANTSILQITAVGDWSIELE